MAGFFNGLLRKRAKASRIIYISWLNKISSKGQIGSTCMGPLASEITFATKKKKLYHVQKQLFYLLELNFERILHNTEYVLRCLKTVWNFYFQSLEISVLFACSTGIRNYNCTSKISSRQLSNTS